jgi:hypothetical protein
MTTGIFVVDTIGSEFENVIHVYEDLGGGSLQFVGCKSMEGMDYGLQLSIDGTAGTDYLISIGGYVGSFGNLLVNISEPEPFRSCAEVVDVPQAECEALVNLYTSTGGESWNNNVGWLSIDRVCAWHGISCSNGIIETIVLPSNNLVGAFAVDLSGFSNLWGIALSNNQLSGDFASILYKMPTGLEGFYIDSNDITGTIPDSISAFSNLLALKVGGNPLTGDLSTIIGYLPTGLVILHLDSTQISGTIPAAIANFPEFYELNLAQNPNMSGTISMGITEIYISTFNFEGTNLCEPDDPAYDDWQATVYTYIPGPCNAGPPDFVIDDITFTPEYPKYGDTVSVTVHARNVGEDQDDWVFVNLYIDRERTGCGDYGDYGVGIDKFSGRTTLDFEFSVYELTAGTHAVYAYIDTYCTVGESNEDNNGYGPIYINVISTSPTVSIASPSDGDLYYIGDLISFNGTASDYEDGDLTADLVWSSDIDGVIGYGGSFDAILSEGTHILTASVVDSDGQSGFAQVTVNVVTNTPPVIEIIEPAYRDTFYLNTPIRLLGSATDAQEGNISHQITWSSNRDGVLGTGTELYITSGTPGLHAITAQITDSVGETAQAEVSIKVLENYPPEIVRFMPKAADGVVGTWYDFTAVYEDSNGASDLVSLQVYMDNGIGDENGLNMLYRVDTNEIFLLALDGENLIGPCTPGEMSTLSNGNVEINCQETVPNSKAEKFIILSFSTRWTQPIDTPILMDVLLRATDRGGNDTGFIQIATWTLLPE